MSPVTKEAAEQAAKEFGTVSMMDEGPATTEFMTRHGHTMREYILSQPSADAKACRDAVDAKFVMDYDNIPGKGPLMLFRKLDDGTMTLATPEHIVEFVADHNALAGIADPAALRAALEELRTAYFAEEAPLFQVIIDNAIEKLCAMLPK